MEPILKKEDNKYHNARSRTFRPSIRKILARHDFGQNIHFLRYGLLNEAIFSLQPTHRVLFVDCFDDQGENMIEKVQLEFSKKFYYFGSFSFYLQNFKK